MGNLGPLIIYVDIDDTIVRSYGNKRIPITKVINHIRELKSKGAILYCWSSAGEIYAENSAKEFGIADCFKSFLPKPNIIIDDQEITMWKRLKCVHPSSCDEITLDHYYSLFGE